MANIIGAVAFRYDPVSEAVIFAPIGKDGLNAASATNPAASSMYAKLEDVSTVIPIQADAVSAALEVISHEHHQIHEGDNYRYFDATTLGSAVSQDYLITTPDTTKWAHFNFTVDGTAVTTFALYEGSDRTGTTPQTVINSNRNSVNVSTTTIKKGTSGGTTDGTLIAQYSSGTATNQSRSGSQLDHGAEWILKRNTKYILRITSSTAGNLCNFIADWYEHISQY